MDRDDGPECRRRPRWASAAVLASFVLGVATACLPPDPPAGWHQRYLTRDGVDVTHVRSIDGGMRMSAPSSNQDSNSRTVF